MHELSRRHFATLLGAGAAAAALPSALARTAPAGPLQLNSNENPHGPSPAAMKALRDSLAEVFRYPDDAEGALVEAIAAHHGVSDAEVLLGNGSSDILRLSAFAFPGKLVTAEPTFEALWRHAAGGQIVKVPLDGSFAHDLAKMREAASGAALVYICNPNNPTATITPKAAMRAFLAAIPPSVTVLVDEAYHHYAESAEYESVAPLVKSLPNLVVARTFSKIYAMAGLRLGYAIAQRPLIAKLNAQQAFNAINLLAAVAGRASLLDTEHVIASRKRNRETREFVLSELRRSGYRALPSEANFVMIDMQREVRPVIQAFRERGIFVGRVFPALPRHLRVTIGTMEEMRRFVEGFAAVVGVRRP
jgi:histidinol-phosphate aminotransferase